MSCGGSHQPWSSSSKDETNKDILSQSPQQYFLLTVAYPSVGDNNGQIVKTVALEPNAGQQQLYLQPVTSVLPIDELTKEKTSDNSSVVIDKEASYAPIVVVNAPLRQHDASNNTTAYLLPHNLTEVATHEAILSQAEQHIQFELDENTPVIAFDGETLPDFTCVEKGILDSGDLNLRDSVLHIESEINQMPTKSAAESTDLQGKDVWNDIDSDIEDEITQIISDKPVIPRAKLTLPNSYLAFGTTSVRKGGICVLAKKEIAKKTQFGPMDGVLKSYEKKHLPCPDLRLLVNTNGSIQQLCIENEELSNWMRYVRVAFRASDQNLALSQIGGSLYFTSIKTIASGEELRVWYSKKYATQRNLPLLSNGEGKWSCPKCPFTCVNNKHMNQHLFKHRAEDNKQYEDTKEASNQESNKETEIAKLKDSWSGAKSGIEDLSLDTVKHRVAWCKECNLRFNSSNALDLHLLTHGTAEGHQNQFKSACLDSEEDFSDLDDPVPDPDQEEDIGIIILVCDICGRTFKNSFALNLHHKIHTEKTSLVCAVCSKTFDQVFYMKRHIKTHMSSDGTFKCPQCPHTKVFASYKQIRRHVKLSHSDVSHPCEICNKKFPTNHKLKLHMTCHETTKHYLCSDCGKQFKRKDKLTLHMKLFHIIKSSHDESNKKYSSSKPPDSAETQKPNPPESGDATPSKNSYSCHICDINFKKRGVLVNHILSRHPGFELSLFPDLNQPIVKPSKDYFCPYCDKVYKSSTKRKAHIKKCHPGMNFNLDDKVLNLDQYTHTVGSISAKPACCKWCSKQYSSNAKLLQHQRKSHLNLLPKPLRIPGYYNPAEFRKNPQGKKGIDDADSPDEVEKPNQQDKNNSLQQTTHVVEVTGSYLADGGIIVDGPTLKKALKLGESSNVECLLDTGLEQLLAESRPDQYFKILTQEGITIAQPVEMWDPLSLTPTSEIQVKSTPLTTDAILS